MDTNGLTMPEARHKAADGSTIKVQLPGTSLQAGAVYYDEKAHKGKLMCKCCEAPVHFRAGLPTIAADNLRGPRPHFASNRQKYHADDCTVKLADHGDRDQSQYNLTKGYLFRVNTGDLRPSFSGATRPYARRSYPHWEIITNNPDLADREAYSARNAIDMQKLIGKKQDVRVSNAVVLNGSDIIPMKNFLFRYVRPDHEDKRYNRKQVSFLRLVDQLQELGDAQLVMMEIDLKSARYSKGKVLCAEGHRIKDIKKNEQGYTTEIIPRVIVARNQNEQTIAALLSGDERVMVMGIVRMRTKVDEEAKKIYRTIDIKAAHPEWIARVSLDQSDRLIRKMPPAPPQTLSLF